MSRDEEMPVRRDGPVAQTRVRGPLSAEQLPALETRLEDLLVQPCEVLWLDLGDVEYVDSDGVRWLQRMRSELGGRGVELRLAVLEGSPPARTVDLLQLDRTFAVRRYAGDPAQAVS